VAGLVLAKSDCSLAATQLLKARALDPFNAEAALLELRTLICQKNFDDFRLKAKQLPTLDKNQDSFAQFLQAQDYLQQKQWRKATDILLKVSEEEPQFPEPYYYLSRANDELGRESTSWAEKYVALCKGISLKARKRFSLEPRLCGFAKEVEDELSKKNADI
jgi:predicted Zn-dependent protease